MFYSIRLKTLNPHPPKSGGYQSPRDFFPCRPTPPPRDLNHVGNLKYIFCGHSDFRRALRYGAETWHEGRGRAPDV